MKRLGVFNSTLAGLVLAVVPMTGQELEKPRNLIEAQKELERAEIKWLLQRVERLEHQFGELQRQVTIKDLQEATRIAAFSTVRIFFQTRNEIQGGSGFFLRVPQDDTGIEYDPERAYILSALHVLEGSVQWKGKLKTPEAKQRIVNSKILKWGIQFASTEGSAPVQIPGEQVRLDALDDRSDIALLSIPKKGRETDRGLVLRDTLAHPLPSGSGQAVILTGFPSGNFMARPLFLSNTQGDSIQPQDGRYIRGPILEFPESGPLNGNSGGPISLPEIHVLDGQRTVQATVVAIVVAKHMDRHMGYALPSDRARAFLHEEKFLKRSPSAAVPASSPPPKK